MPISSDNPFSFSLCVYLCLSNRPVTWMTQGLLYFQLKEAPTDMFHDPLSESNFLDKCLLVRTCLSVSLSDRQ